MAAGPEKNVQAEYEALQLEETRYRVAELRGHQNAREIRKRVVETSLRNERVGADRTQGSCAHRKGGLGNENTYRGNDQNFAVAKFILPFGGMIVICQRCFKLWEPPDPALNSRGATVEDKRLYAKQVKEYQEAISYPTDNTPGGSQIYVVTQDQIAA